MLPTTTGRRTRRVAVAAVAATLTLGFATASTRSADAVPHGTAQKSVQKSAQQSVRPSATRPAGLARAMRGVRGHSVVANLWEWNWPSIARECTTELGPKGYGAVQVAPPQDSVKRTELGNGQDTILHPWWEVYQAVDYALTSRMGTERQFRSMVTACRRAGVKVYVDAVLNHMTGQGSTSYGGRTFERYSYPDAGYTRTDFHKYSGDCPSASGGIEDFNNQQQVFACELVGLADLRTDTRRVRARLAAYLNKLIGYGVSGFRVDAAKHIGQDDLDAIRARLHRTVDGTRPFWALEVFGGGPGSLSPAAFERSGYLLGLDGVKQLRDAFRSPGGGSIAVLQDFGDRSGLTSSRRTLSFVQNHDTERNGDALTYKDGATNTLATQFLLASGYGRPQVFSSFSWTDRDASPPATADGLVTDTVCGAAWTCTHRDDAIEALVAWHDHVGGARRANWWDDGANVIAFSRGHRGWAAFNNGTSPSTITVRTGLRRGTYCDAVSGGSDGCAGVLVRVRRGGVATVTVPAKGAVAVDRTDRR
jgi:alpha-amylase